MKIKGISIENFRGLRDVRIHQCDEHVNLFVGVNGAGKSSILEAMTLVFSWFTARMLSATGRGHNIPIDDISHNASNGCSIKLGLENGDVWKLYRSRKYHKSEKSDLSSMNRYVTHTREKLDIDATTSLPIIAYYGVNRVISNKYPKLPRGKNEIPQLATYKNALGGGISFADFFNWFRLSEDYENEQYKADKLYREPGLEAVRRCMATVMPEYSDMKVTRRPLALTMKKGDETFKLNQLSDGEKCYISLVCDIARRLAIANPDGDPLKGEGIILIDEVDLHLHPKWQQIIVSKLVETFPNCQFFITTHSPIVASDVDGKVFGIKNGEIVPYHTFGKLASGILSSVFDMETARNLFVQSTIESAYNAIHEGDEASYKRYLNQLINILGADDPDITGLRIEKIRRDKVLAK